MQLKSKSKNKHTRSQKAHSEHPPIDTQMGTHKHADPVHNMPLVSPWRAETYAKNLNFKMFRYYNRFPQSKKINSQTSILANLLGSPHTQLRSLRAVLILGTAETIQHSSFQLKAILQNRCEKYIYKNLCFAIIRNCVINGFAFPKRKTV